MKQRNKVAGERYKMLSLEEKHEYSVRAAKISDAKGEGDCWHEAKRVLKNLQHSVSPLHVCHIS